MKVQEAIDKVNSKKCYSLWDAEDLIDFKKEVSDLVDVDHHRWYTIGTKYYEMEDGFLGLTGVDHTHSETMMIEDCEEITVAFEAEPYYVTAYRKKRK